MCVCVCMSLCQYVWLKSKLCALSLNSLSLSVSLVVCEPISVVCIMSTFVLPFVLPKCWDGVIHFGVIASGPVPECWDGVICHVSLSASSPVPRCWDGVICGGVFHVLSSGPVPKYRDGVICGAVVFHFQLVVWSLYTENEMVLFVVVLCFSWWSSHTVLRWCHLLWYCVSAGGPVPFYQGVEMVSLTLVLCFTSGPVTVTSPKVLRWCHLLCCWVWSGGPVVICCGVEFYLVVQ